MQACLLSESACRRDYRVEAHESVTSTNRLALERAREGDQGRLWIVAQEQTQGVGRRGRVWHSPKGNLYASLLLVEDFAPDCAALLGFVAGVAMAQALTSLIGNDAKIQLKWPNDVLLNGAKLTGILVERSLIMPTQAAVMIGIGTNIVQAPQQADYAVASLAASGFAITPAQLFNQLSHFWTLDFDLWHGGQGFNSIRKKWLEFAAGLGREIHVIRQSEPVSGIFKTIDETGQLVIERDGGGQAVIAAGDVHFGDAATLRQNKDMMYNAG